MPLNAVLVWLITGGLCFVVGTFFLWRIERSGVRRWGACGSLFGLGERIPPGRRRGAEAPVGEGVEPSEGAR
jgi:hypothetical protein